MMCVYLGHVIGKLGAALEKRRHAVREVRKLRKSFRKGREFGNYKEIAEKIGDIPETHKPKALGLCEKHLGPREHEFLKTMLGQPANRPTGKMDGQL